MFLTYTYNRMCFVQLTALLQMLPWEVNYMNKSIQCLDDFSANQMLRFCWTPILFSNRKESRSGSGAKGQAMVVVSPHYVGVYSFIITVHNDIKSIRFWLS